MAAAPCLEQFPQAVFGGELTVTLTLVNCCNRSAELVLPETVYALPPDVLGVRGRHVHVQVANIGLLGVGL